MEEFEIGSKDLETLVKARAVEVEGKKELMIEIPVPKVKLWFDRKSLDNFIKKLEDLKKVI